MEVFEIEDETSEEFEEVMQIYENAFPPEESISRETFKRILLEKREGKFDKVRMNVHLIGIKLGNQMIGMAHFSYFDELNIGFGEYLCIEPQFWGKGFGGALLNQMIEILKEDAKRRGKILAGVVLEVEKENMPNITKEKRKTRERRVRFFRRRGAKIIEGIDYLQPSLVDDQPAVPFHLIVFPLIQKYWETLTPEKITEIVRIIYEKNYVLKNNRPYDREYMEKFVNSIQRNKLYCK